MEYDYIKKGNCLELMNDIQDKSIDLILCDLPYGETNCKWDNIISFPDLWKHYDRVLKDTGTVALFSSQPFTTKLINSNPKYFKYCWYWKKNATTGFAFSKFQPLRQIEEICIFYKKPQYYPQGLIAINKPRKKRHNYRDKEWIYDKNGLVGKDYVSKFKNYPKNVLEFNVQREGLHPTQKPVDLLEYLIKTYTNPNDIVLDNCMGSGSTCIASINTGRHYIGIEQDENHFNTANERIEKHKKFFYNQSRLNAPELND